MRRTVIALCAAALLSACGRNEVPTVGQAPPGEKPLTVIDSPEPESPSPAAPASAFARVEVAAALDVPVALTFAPDGRLFFAEAKSGRIRVIDPKTGLAPTPVATLEISKVGEFGLVGLALDPNFARNHRIYAYLTEPNPDGTAKRNKVIRLVENGGTAVVEKEIIGDIPSSKIHHVAGRLRFGPDGMLYVAVGDTQRGELAQDPSKIVGKILRVTPEGDPPADNPFPGSRAFAVGFRNPYGIAFDPLTQRLFAVENGPTVFDEVNLVEKGGNYGHPRAHGPSNGRFKDPIWHSGRDSHGMSGIAVVRNSRVKQFKDTLMFCSFDDTKLHAISLLADGGFGPDQPVEGVPCSLDVEVSPDGIVHIAHAGAIFKLQPA